ncbi:hypothetical protein BHU72_05170 [Desulfuribacillus stibiiarsenatis]|uniref:Copper amine oxidase-like N-terminal domain-containing protein n=1 Tax=Desulfuribacillus stibiiarsenatis TaxID=1390249 RepID=A0A1E5L616_9FIRM|nr:copper amine oxidase N-terminal domain-containing protein [Desulfuribacillus stibiiarsenatis]OEH85478.1 hypothetical protein BHU72_05170 [Desulfuribacillus stibiiarsenatis]
MRDQQNQGKVLSTPLKNQKRRFSQGGETKFMKKNKLIASFLVFALLVTLVAPIGVASAATTYSAVSVAKFTKSTSSALGVIQVTADPMLASSSALIKLPSDVKNITVSAVTGANTSTNAITISGINGITDATNYTYSQPVNEFRVTVAPSITGQKTEFFIYITADTSDLAAGDVVATITGLSGQLPSGSVTVANILGSGTTDITVSTPKFISGNNNEVIFTLTESIAGALDTKASSLKLTLPNGYTWSNTSASAVIVGNQVVNALTSSSDGRVLTVDTQKAGSPSKSIIRLTANVNVNDNVAKHGDVIATVSGDNKFNAAELTVAKYADFGVKTSVKDKKSIVAGQANKKIGTVVVEETAPASLVNGRTIYLTLPEGAKWNNAFSAAMYSGSNTLAVTTPTSPDAISNEGRTLKVVLSAASTGNAGKLEIQDLTVDTAVDFKGEIAVELSGNSGLTGKLVVADVTAPITATATKADVKIGLQNQKAGNIVIKETAKERLIKDGKLEITFANTAATFQNTPTVKVTEGDIDVEISKSSTMLTITVKRDSSVASTIEISNILMTVDRSVAEGDLTLNIRGNATNNAISAVDARFPDNKTVAKVVNASVTTPAPDSTPVTPVPVTPVSAFVVDSKNYTVNGVTKTMDVAPFIQNGRTMLPVRFVAEALGVSEDNIIWNASTKQVTIMKGDRIAQLTIGSDTLLVNGVTVKMDTVASTKDGRTVLPVRFVAQALGANIDWDAATRTVSVK